MDGSESQEVDSEIEESFHAVMENLKSEETKTVDLQPSILSEEVEEEFHAVMEELKSEKTKTVDLQPPILSKEVGEEFHAVMENLKSEETKTVDLQPPILSKEVEESFHTVMRNLKSGETNTVNTVDTVAQVYLPLLSHCRLCAMPDTNMVHIFGSNATAQNIRLKIIICLPVTVRETDTLPKQVCFSCLEELDQCYRFHQTVAKAEKKLLVFAGVTPGKLEKTEQNRGTFPPYDKQHEPSDGTSKRTSDVQLIVSNDDEPMSNPEDVGTVDATVERNDPLLKMTPRSVVLPTPEIRQKNNFAAKKDEKSSSDSRHQNPDINDNEAFDFGTTTTSGVGEQSSSDSVITRVARRSSVVDDMQGKKAENEGHTASNKRSCTEKRRYRCTTCAKMFSSGTELTRHNKTHAVAKELHRCDLCFKMYKSKYSLSRHYKFHTGKGLQNCDYCGKKFVDKHALVSHRRIHTGERPFKCSICKKRFSLSCNLKVHGVRFHSERRAYPCSMCDKSFKMSTDRKRHMLVHRDKTSQWQCDHCKFYFKARKSLVRHILRTCLILHVHRDKTSQWQCDHCKSYFKEKKNLVQHILRTCRKRFPRK